MPYLVLGAAIVLGAILVSRWYVNAQPGDILKALKWIGAILAGVVAVVLIVTGRFGLALFALPLLLPFLMRARAAQRAAKNWSRMSSRGSGGGGGTGQTSEVETAFVRMYLDHDSGEMNGDILAGQFTGQTLRRLELDQLLMLLAEAREDEQSVQVITAYLDRYHGDEWRERASDPGAQGGKNGSSGTMTREEAYDILDLEPGADADTIKQAHHKLMSKIHPDHGGSTYLATKINQAKDLLLGE